MNNSVPQTGYARPQVLFLSMDLNLKRLELVHQIKLKPHLNHLTKSYRHLTQRKMRFSAVALCILSILGVVSAAPYVSMRSSSTLHAC